MIQKQNQGDIDRRLTNLEVFTEIPEYEIGFALDDLDASETPNPKPKSTTQFQTTPTSSSNTITMDVDNNVEVSIQSRDDHNNIPNQMDQIQKLLVSFGSQLQSVSSEVA
jgi:hypothetical protein